ncbi:hypothetical protein EDB38_10759 [Vibrio crassostreae]|nr:hypothetical protein EDB36_1245 [Vibrio crassostreae]ROR21335.1 hypothetical protein EDB67_112115 [Vibrio crassostreae]TCN77898.1 hypothetical protein EDB62_105168 [Vibrio crassostreae]TCN98210.1 hypothetical protein EDB30_114124 [Vibrio crassostreae]TCT50885.1 hypothetical protein EDB42_10759 [Vibrio crassostreae]
MKEGSLARYKKSSDDIRTEDFLLVLLIGYCLKQTYTIKQKHKGGGPLTNL